MKGTSRTRSTKRTQKQVPQRATPGQIARQVGLILVVIVIWAGLLAVFLKLTSTAQTPVSGTPQATEAVAVPQLTPSSALTAVLPSPGAGGVSFSQDVLPILTNRCQRCHGGGRTSAGIDLSSYASIMAGSPGGPIVIPSNSAASRLVESIVSGQMPRGSGKLPASEIETISNWVDQGALDN